MKRLFLPVNEGSLRDLYYLSVWIEETLSKTYEIKKRYAHQVFGNAGNFQITYSDGIVVLTHTAWAAITTLYARFPTTSE